MESNEIDLSMYIGQAIDIAEKIMQGRILLTCSIESMRGLDEVIEYIHSLWEKKLISDTSAWNLSVAFGALLGEMILREEKEEKFHWTIGEHELPVIETPDHDWISPITKIYKLITGDGSDGTPSGFYRGFKALQQYCAKDIDRSTIG